MNPLATKLQEAAQQAAHTLHLQHHPHARLLEQMRLVQDVHDENVLHVYLPVPDSKAYLLFPTEDRGFPPDKLQRLDTEYWADKMIGYINASVADGLLPSAEEMWRAQQSASPSQWRLADKVSR